MYQQSPKAPKKSKPFFKRKWVIQALIGGGFAVLVAIIGGIFPLIANNHPTPASSPFSSLTPTSSTPLTSIPNTPVLTPTPTIPINQTMSCTNCGTSDNFSLIVKSATIDPAQSQLTLVIGVKNVSTDDKSEVQFKYLKLQDIQTGVTADGGGEGFSSFAISVNSQILFRPTFQFVPVTGHEYSLSAELDSFDVGWAYHLFSPITIKF